MWRHPHCSSPSSVQFSPRQHSKSLPLSISVTPVSTPSNKPSAASHHGTSTKSIYSTRHTYQSVNQPMAQQVEQPRNRYKSDRISSLSIIQRLQEDTSRRTSQLQYIKKEQSTPIDQEGPVSSSSSSSNSPLQ